MVLSFIPNGTRIPKIRKTKLSPETPYTAVNADNSAGNLAPRAGVKKVTLLTKSGDLRTLFRTQAKWVAWEDVVDVVRSQIINSAGRFYFTGDSTQTGPRQTNTALAFSGAASTYPTSSRPLGVEAPEDTLTITEYGDEDEELDDVVVSYIVTYVTDWGEESAPNTAGVLTTIPGGKYVSIKGLAAPAADYISYFRVYRLESGSDSADYQAVALRPGSIGATALYDIPVATVTSVNYQLYDANHASTPTGLADAGTDVCPSEDWLPPDEDMINLTQYLNSVMIGSFDNILCMSEPMIPYAWPIEYRQEFEYDIVALGVYRSVIVVLTDAYVFLVDGTDPSGMVKKRLEYLHGCVSKRGAVSTNFGVVYPSPEGLCLVDSTSVTNVTFDLFTPEQWDALSPDTLIGFYHNDSYIGFFEGTDQGIILSPKGNGFELKEFELGVDIYGGFIREDTNVLTLIGEYSNGVYYTYTWEAGSDLTYEWWSKTFVSHPTNYAVIQIRGPFDSGSITVSLEKDGAVDATTLTIANENFRWLSSGSLYRSLAIGLEGTSQIDQVLLAHSPEELLDVVLN
jgi:hypothetical protein